VAGVDHCPASAFCSICFDTTRFRIADVIHADTDKYSSRALALTQCIRIRGTLIVT
jgi:hypothetical protein